MTFIEAVTRAETEEPNGSQEFDGGGYRQWYGDKDAGLVNWLVDYDEHGKPCFVQQVGTDNTWGA